jgi:hypothetical protein
MFQRNILPPPSGSKNKPSKKPASSRHHCPSQNVELFIATAVTISIPLIVNVLPKPMLHTHTKLAKLFYAY